MKKLKRALILTHRWIGVGTCLLFFLWFYSGIIMMYVEFPELTEEERLESLLEIPLDDVNLSVNEVLARQGGAITQLRMTAVLGRPAYQIVNERNLQTTIFADDGSYFEGLNEARALDAVTHSGYASQASNAQYRKELMLDQWTVSSGLNSSRPLHKIDLNDDAGTTLYVSAKTGQIARDTNRNERFWNWLGSTVHWVYPVQLRQHGQLWGQVIIVLSLIGVFSVVTGGIVGVMRLRVRKRFANGSMSPYSGIDKWHHILGLASLVFVFTFIFSGLMSMGPWGIFSSKTSPAPQVARYTGATFDTSRTLPEPTGVAIDYPVKEMEWFSISGNPYLVTIGSLSNRQVLFNQPELSGMTTEQTLAGQIEAALPDLIPSASLTSVEMLESYDDYYYSRHNRYRPLPIYRAKFDDVDSSWFHLDATTGEVLNRVTSASRLERWLYNGLHSLDFQFLVTRGILWDFVVILLSLIGIGFSLTSCVIGWRRLTVKTAFKK